LYILRRQLQNKRPGPFPYAVTLGCLEIEPLKIG
jgi:hypothetical protein